MKTSLRLYQIREISCIFLVLFSSMAFAQNLSSAQPIIPLGNNNNDLYYKIGGGSDFALPAVSSTQTIQLDALADLGSGYSCGAFNPALSIANSLNNIKNESDNVEQSVLNNATGSVAEMPMYFLSQADPTLYNLINNALIRAHNALNVSTKSCQEVKSEIAMHQNPYKDWATLAVNDQWKKHLSLTATGNEDINAAKQKIDQNPGVSGVSWVQGVKDNNNHYYAGGESQPPIHVISDTVKAGYNALLMRDLTDDSSISSIDSNSQNENNKNNQNNELAQDFSTPKDAQTWIINVVGDQTITTCTTPDCVKQQGGISGRGLLPWINASSDIRNNLTNLVLNKAPLTNQNLANVSANGIVISPDIIRSIQGMSSSEQAMMITKISQEVATQKIINKALLARNILQTGSQVPVIAANAPAQKVIHQAMRNLDNDIQSLSFEAKVRRQMMSDTLSAIVNYQHNSESKAITVPKIISPAPLLKNSAIDNEKNN